MTAESLDITMDTQNLQTDEDAQNLASQGYKPELERRLGFYSILFMLLCINGAWVSLGGALQTGIYQGGPCGVVYGLILTFFIYCCTGSCVSDLVSSMPCAGGPYYWVYTAANPKYSRVMAWYVGYTNMASQLFGASSNALVVTLQVSALIELINPQIVVKTWQSFVLYEGLLLTTLLVTTVGNRGFKYVTLYGGCAVAIGFFIMISAVPAKAPTHQTSSFVWKDFINQTGWSSNAICFFTGLPNTFYAFGLIDSSIHMAEEIPRPQYNIPRAIFAQFAIGIVTGLAFLIAMFYSIQDISGILSPVTGNPLIELFAQVFNKGGAVCLSLIAILAGIAATYEGQVITSRLVWSFARDNAIPFSSLFSRVNIRYNVPIYAVFLVLVISMLLGLIFLFAEAAFNAIVGSCLSFHNLMLCITFTTMVLTNRKRVPPGPFHLKGTLGMVIYSIAALLMALMVVMFCLPYSMPTSVGTFNWTPVIIGGLYVLVTIWWFLVGRRTFRGPPAFVHPEILESLQYMVETPNMKKA